MGSEENMSAAPARFRTTLFRTPQEIGGGAQRVRLLCAARHAWRDQPTELCRIGSSGDVIKHCRNSKSVHGDLNTYSNGIGREKRMCVVYSVELCGWC